MSASSTLMEVETHIDIGEAQRRIEETPTEPIEPPSEQGAFELDQAVVDAFPIQGTKLVHAVKYAESLCGRTAKVVVELPDGRIECYFLKVVMGETGAQRCEGEYESLKAVYAVSPGFAPIPYAWGKCKNQASEAYFLLEEFRYVRKQPADPLNLATKLADLHRRSISPTGKFGFHVKTWHGTIAQEIDQWDDSWAALFGRHLGHIMEVAKPLLKWPEFDTTCKLTREKVIPRLLLPLQENGRVLKPSLIHGDCWDGNTALDAQTGEACVWDMCSFYGHNEYDTGNWRAPRHRLSDKAYILCYKRHYAPSEPAEDWGARNLLYSLPFNIGTLINIPGSQQREIVYGDLTTLCRMFCPEDLDLVMEAGLR